MIGTIKFIADVQQSQYYRGTWNEFKAWFVKQTMYQLDIETNVVDKWNEYRLISIQFGSCTGERIQWFIQWSELSAEQREEMKSMLEDMTKLKLIHNAKFEYIVLRFHDIIIDNVYDTMLAEKVLKGGLEIADYALADISYKYLRIIMDKSEQTNFGDNIINDKKILYGVTDVAYLDVIRKIQISEALTQGLINVFALEMDAVFAFSDITYNGMKLDQDKWRDNIRLAEPLVAESLTKMNKWLEHDHIITVAHDLGYISNVDRITVNYSTQHQIKSELLKLIFPDIVGGTKPIITKYIRDNGKVLESSKLNILMECIEKNHTSFQTYLLEHHRDYLIAQGYLIPAGTSTINWNSTDQVLPIVRCVVPKITSLGEDERNKFSHKILDDLTEYKERLKLINDLGEEFIRKYVDSDGMVRTNFNQIVSTGRVSSSRPNMQNIIVKEFVGTRYRNAFVPHAEGWSFVSSDYISQELVLIAYLSKEPAWLEALQQGKDLHSVLAEIVYGTKWKDAADPDCNYYKMVVNAAGELEMNKHKCDCKKHKPLRYDVKTVNFLLAYGGTEYKLSGELDISLKEAKALMELYFSKLPLVSRLFKFLAKFTLDKGYAMTMYPFNRKRWFQYWRENRPYIQEHLEDIRYNKTLGEIQKAGMNHPIQGTSADITKVAMVLVRQYIRDNDLWHKIRLVAQVHDQIDTNCTDDIKDEWKLKLDELMCDAGKVVIPSGLLRADTNITANWTK